MFNLKKRDTMKRIKKSRKYPTTLKTPRKKRKQKLPPLIINMKLHEEMKMSRMSNNSFKNTWTRSNTSTRKE